jgi:predicted HicB family RNase H-like nuclease
MLNYKGYMGYVEFDEEAEIFHGEVINTKDIITFQGRTVKEIKKAFIDSIDDYLEFCADRGERPEKPFSGKLNLRLTPDIHREAYIAAKYEGMSLNTWIVDTVKEAIHHHQQA